jgi:hypothetical protein
MLQELLPLVPPDAGKIGIGVGMGAAIIGLLLWIAGARFSRQMLTLLLVSVGAYLGKKLPEWYSINFSPAAFAVGAAIACGVAGYAMHRFWVGLSLGLTATFWSALSIWMLRRGETAWSWPSLSADMTVADFCTALWASLPEAVRLMLPYAAGASMVSGVVFALIKPRLATVMNWSTMGTTLMLIGSLVSIQSYQPAWFAKAPAELWAQLSCLGAIVAFGAIVQWKIAPPGKVNLPKVQKTED